MPPPSLSDPYHDQARLRAVQLMLCLRLVEAFDALGVSLYHNSKMFFGPCPVHGGDNVNALNVYPEGDTLPGFWKCRTRSCHQTFKPTIIGFVRGVLSHQKHGWTADDTTTLRTVSWRNAVDWCCSFLNADIRSIKVDYAAMDRMQFASGVSRLTQGPLSEPMGVNREVVRSFLEVPSPYFLSRGFLPETLEKFVVGDYGPTDRPLSNRAVVPVFGRDGKRAVGFTGRSTHPQCILCSRWHSLLDSCPERFDPVSWGGTAKWFNQGLDKQGILFNLHASQKAVARTGVVALVEGPPDVMRLVEAGAENVVALLGAELHEAQQVLLEMCGASEVVVFGDGDAGGDGMRRQVREKLCRSFRLRFPELGAKDLGGMSREDVRRDVVPMLGGVA